MFWEVFAHEYFWLSFLPISFLGTGFWLLFFDRARDTRDPLPLLFMAVGAGVLSCVLYSLFGGALGIKHFLAQVFWEEFFKMYMAIVAMELFKHRFKSIAGGVVYGFAVGLGFAMAENIIYLSRVYELYQFDAGFWLTWQGRFWSSTILHGVTMAIFGLFYASAYLHRTIAKDEHESPLKVFWTLPSLKQVWRIFTLDIARKHMLFECRDCLGGYRARTVILEGFWAAVLVHAMFNLALEYSFPEISIILALFFMWYLRYQVDRAQ